MRIGILEICSKNHYVLIESWSKVLKSKGHSVVAYSNAETAALLSDQVECITLPTGFLARIWKIRRESKKLDLFIITSIQAQWALFASLSITCPVWTTIHNARTWAKPAKAPNIRTRFRQLVRAKWARASKMLIVNSTNMHQWMLSTDWNRKNDIFVMPFQVRNETDLTPKEFTPGSPFRIAIPGILSQSRKDYSLIKPLCQKFGNKLELRFLGAPNAKEGGDIILKELQETALQTGTTIKSFSEFIAPSEFEKELGECNIVWGDVKVHHKRYEYDEIYGVTKDSGLSYAMIIYQIPGVFNADFKNLQELESCTLSYSSLEEFIGLIQGLLDHPDQYAKLVENIISASHHFTVAAISARISKILHQ